MNKKGMDISLNFIILAVLALIALIVIALFFTGGLTNLFKQQQDVGSISAEKLALYTSKCNLYCTTDDEVSFNNPQFAEASIKDKTCNEFFSYISTKETNVQLKKFEDTDNDGEKECVNK